MGRPGNALSSAIRDAWGPKILQIPQSHQGICADAIATLEGISREDTDRLALLSQQRAAAAIANGYFSKSLVPVFHEDGRLALDKEEYPRPQTTLEGLAALKPAFSAVADFPLDDKGTTYRGLILQKYPDLQINHIHHAGNSSGIVDGSAAILLASPSYVKKRGLKPRARVVAMANMGDSPTLMLNAPVPATRKVLAKAGLGIDEIDLFEINEAFAVVARPQFLCARSRMRDRRRPRHPGRLRRVHVQFSRMYDFDPAFLPVHVRSFSLGRIRASRKS